MDTVCRMSRSDRDEGGRMKVWNGHCEVEMDVTARSCKVREASRPVRCVTWTGEPIPHGDCVRCGLGVHGYWRGPEIWCVSCGAGVLRDVR